MNLTTSPGFSRPNQLVINWHVTEACNYACQYCYAKWEPLRHPRELFHDPARSHTLLGHLYQFFHPDNLANPLRRQMEWDSVRLNIAGGEPLLYPQKVLDIVSAAQDIGFEISLITNGSRLTPVLMEKLAPAITLLGVSIDSSSDRVNRAIGRGERDGRHLDITTLAGVVNEGRRSNPQLRVKINTVVNRVNYLDDMTGAIHLLRPGKWKILRMLPIVDGSLAVSQEEFDGFVQRHAHLAAIRHVEDNADMTESYLMVDPLGRFFQNSSKSVAGGYRYSAPILEVGAERAFANMRFSAPRFLVRYQPASAESRP